jgi:phenylalanyl-tRNA synthetase beta chain
MNPLGEDYSIMRTTSLNGMLTSLATNYNRRNKNVRLYEMGNISSIVMPFRHSSHT